VVILADEATGNLDTRTSFEIMALFQELNSQGKTIVFVTHELDIARFTSRNIVFRDGMILRTENVTERNNAVEMLKDLPVTDDAPADAIATDAVATDDKKTAKS
jgi:putative ABC transport system ATP-binding protein